MLYYCNERSDSVGERVGASSMSSSLARYFLSQPFTNVQCEDALLLCLLFLHTNQKRMDTVKILNGFLTLRVRGGTYKFHFRLKNKVVSHFILFQNHTLNTFTNLTV